MTWKDSTEARKALEHGSELAHAVGTPAPGFSRRDLVRRIAACAAVGTLGSVGAVRAFAQEARVDRKFLFFFASGGWDATPLDPKFGPDGVSAIDGTDMDPDTHRAQLGNLSWSGGLDRVNMDVYFARWGGRSHLLRGINVHSAGHEAGMQWMMTGTSASSVSDWPTVLAANGQVDYPMPHLVFAGPSYPGPFGSAVVRGGGGTLLSLLDGTFSGRTDRPAPVVAAPADAIMDAYVHGRTARYAVERDGMGRAKADALVASLERSFELEGRRFEAGLSDRGRTMLDEAMMAVEVMRLGLSRCAITRIPGGWDTHGGNGQVGAQLDRFFGDLDEILSHLATTPGAVAPWLIDEVTLVCTSELGRTPRFNGSMGRDHWPYTSMMVAGSGVRGNAVSGATDDRFIAETIDLDTGLVSATGTTVGTEHVGTGLLELGGLDPERFLPGIQPLRSFQRRAG